MAKSARGVTKGPRMINEIIRLQNLGLGTAKIASALGCSRNTVKKYLRLESKSSLPTHDKPQQVYEAPWASSIDWRIVKGRIDCGVTVRQFWEDNLASVAGLSQVTYVSFWREFKRRFPNIPIDYHKTHPPGERCEVDYKGDSHGLGFYDRHIKEFTPCRLFGSILCFSQLFFAKATLTEQQADLLGGIAASYEYFGGTPHTTAFDNAKASVFKAHRYDPDVNPEFSKFCEHYGTAELAMRPYKPRDKNLIENVLGVFWRWARVRIREHKCFSLGELNKFLLGLLNEFNERIQRKYGSSRCDKFLRGEKEALRALPPNSYEFGEWKKAKLHPDSHIQHKYNFYSAPFALRGKELEVRISKSHLEIFHSLERVSLHAIASSSSRGRYLTNDDHLPPHHVAMKEMSPNKIMSDATEVGAATEKVITNLITKARHPLMHLRRCQGILRLKQRYSKKSLEHACKVIVQLDIEMPRLRDIEGIVKNNLKETNSSNLPIQRGHNPNLRGQQSWLPETYEGARI